MRRHVVLGRLAIAAVSIASFVGIAAAPAASAVSPPPRPRAAAHHSPAAHRARLDGVGSTITTTMGGTAAPFQPITDGTVAPRAANVGSQPAGGVAPSNAVSTSTFVDLPGVLWMPDKSQPGALDRPSMTYDAAHNQDVEFGGCVGALSASCTDWAGTTWTFDGVQWTKQSPSASPAGRTETTLTYDATTSTSVLFGGENATGALSTTWIWNGTTWIKYTGTTHPSARYGAVTAYLPSTGDVYLFGGQTSATAFLSTTWEWNGTTWTQLSPSTSPSARALSAMAYAGTIGGSANDLVLVGGDGAAGVLSDTWTFNGTTWTKVATARAPVENAGLAYDATLHVPVLYGGENTTHKGNYWAWNGTKWLRAISGYTTGLTDEAMAQDPKNGQLVINGGSYDLDHAPNNATTYELLYENEEPSTSTLITHRLDAAVTAIVNPVDTKPVLAFHELNVSGENLPLNLGQDYAFTDGCVSEYLGCATTAGLLDVSALAQPDGTSVLLLMPDGSLTYCPKTGTTWACPGGSGLSYNGSAITATHPELTYDLNTNGTLHSLVDRNGNTITINYPSGSDEATSITDDEGRTTTLTYTSSADGQLKTITDPLGRTLTFTYDTTLGTPTPHTVTLSDPTDPSGSAATTLHYGDVSGLHSLFVTTPASRETVFEMSGLNRVYDFKRVVDKTTLAGARTKFTFQHPGYVTLEDPNGHTTTYTLTGNQVVKVTDPFGHTESTAYNPDSDPTTLVNNLTEVTNLSWDRNDNLTSITAPATGTDTALSAAYAYTTPTTGTKAVKGGQYLPSSYTTGEDNCTSFGYDGNGNLTTTTTGLVPSTPPPTGQPKGNCSGTNTTSTTTKGYQGDVVGGTTVACTGKPGDLCTITTPAGGVTKITYDSRGDPVSVEQPGGSCTTPRKLCTTYTYDQVSEVATSTDGKGQTTTYSYNKYGQVTQALFGGATTCTLASGKCVKFSYDQDGNVTSRSDKSGTTTYVYDPLARLVKEELPTGKDACAGTSPGAITYTYDTASNLTAYCDAGGNVTYAYDAANRLVGVATTSGSCTPGSIVQPCTQYGYNTLNELTSITYPTSTGWTAAMTYSSAGSETGVTYKKGSTTEQALTYSYKKGTNGMPLVQSATDSSTGVTTDYSYDAQDRLLKATTGTASSTDSYAYTADGNLTTVDLGGTTTSMAYNPANELCWTYSGNSTSGCSSAPSGSVTFTYDADGNQVSNSAGEAISYNSLNQTTKLKPAGGTTESFTYTGVGQSERISAGTATFANNELGIASRTKGTTTTYFTSEPTGKTGRLESMQVVTSTSSNRYYYLYDGTGNVIGLVNSSGGRAATYAYTPYGTTTASTGGEASTNPFRYEAGYTDTTGFIHFGARYLNPDLGTWTQQDPAMVSPSCAYAGDDPVNIDDPTGAGFYGWVPHTVWYLEVLSWRWWPGECSLAVVAYWEWAWVKLLHWFEIIWTGPCWVIGVEP